MLEYLSLLKESLKGKTEDSNEYKLYKVKLVEMIECDLRKNNPDKLFDKYLKLLSEKDFLTKTINKGEIFYRGRIGKMTLHGAIDDCNQSFTTPYYGGNICEAPPINTEGGRFNRAGISYLYLASDLVTCFAEIHL